MSDPWEDEGFGGEDDWEAESLETGLEDEEGDDELEPEPDEHGDDDDELVLGL
jgi:hypothetical protein